MSGGASCSRLCLATVLIGLVALAPLSGLPEAGGLPGAENVVVGEVTYADGTFTFDEPIVVTAGATLRFEDATVFLDHRLPTCDNIGLCPAHIILDGGRLEIIRSTVDTTTPDDHNPDGIQQWRIFGEAGSYHFEDSDFRHVGSVSMTYPGQEMSLLRGNTFQTGTFGPSFSRGATALVTGNLFEDMHSSGSGRDTVTSWIGNTFRGGVGYTLDLQGTLVGDRVFASGHTVVGNTFEDNWMGMLHLDAGPSLIADNEFLRNEIGINLGIGVGSSGDGTTAVINDNRFEENDEGMLIYTSGLLNPEDDVVLDAQGNAFIDNPCHDISLGHHSGVSFELDVRHSWWGSPDGPRGPNGQGCTAIEAPAATTVLVEPWLEEEP